MIAFSIGLPSPFSDWCDIVSARIAGRASGPIETITARTLQDIALAAIRTRSSNLLVRSCELSARVAASIADAESRFVLALDDPRAALHHLVTCRGMSFADAVRAVACSCAATVSFAGLSGGLKLSPLDVCTNPHETVAAIGDYFGRCLSTEDIVEITRDLDGFQISDDSIAKDEWWASLDEHSREIANGALNDYRAYFSGREIGSFLWERDLFFMDEPPASGRVQVLRPVDITGRPRCLIFGPHLTLPPGSWSALISLSLSPEAMEMTYVLEAFAGSRLASSRIEPVSQRLIEVELRFSVDNLLEQPIEIRVWSERAAFDGQLALGHVRVTATEPIRATTRDVLETPV